MSLIDRRLGIIGLREGGATTWLQVTFDKFDEAAAFNEELIDLLLRYMQKDKEQAAAAKLDELIAGITPENVHGES